MRGLIFLPIVLFAIVASALLRRKTGRTGGIRRPRPIYAILRWSMMILFLTSIICVLLIVLFGHSR